MAALVDTSVLVARFDPRVPRKQRIAENLIRRGILAGGLRIPHQALGEFVSAVTRETSDRRALLTWAEACEEAEALLAEIGLLYPTDAIVRTALRGAAAYNLPWLDAQMWAHAEHYGLSELYSEDFQHDRLYGTVRAINPFL